MIFAMAAQRFEAEVEAEDDRLFVEVPAAVVVALGPRRRPPLVIEVNGYRYRSTAAVYGGRTYLGFRKDIREAAGLSAGQRVAVSLELDEEPREVDVPNDLEDALRADPTAQAAFAALSFTHRKEYVEWVESAKRGETRRRRIERTVTILRPGPKDT
jgi:Bacteriocin-protection, YdeI or OmpD-Associated/Domain of unknown function (DUF1905)